MENDKREELIRKTTDKFNASLSKLDNQQLEKVAGGGDPIFCNFCWASFTDQDRLDYHIEKCHKKQKK